MNWTLATGKSLAELRTTCEKCVQTSILNPAAKKLYDEFGPSSKPGYAMSLFKKREQNAKDLKQLMDATVKKSE